MSTLWGYCLHMTSSRKTKTQTNRRPFNFAEAIKDIQSDPTLEEIAGILQAKDVINFKLAEALLDRLREFKKADGRISFGLGPEIDDGDAQSQLDEMEQSLQKKFLRKLSSDGIITSLSFRSRQEGSGNIYDPRPYWKMEVAEFDCSVRKLSKHLQRLIQAGKKIRSRPTYKDGTVFYLERSLTFRAAERKRLFEILWSDRRIVRSVGHRHKIHRKGSLFPFHFPSKDEVVEQMARDLNKQLRQKQIPIHIEKHGSSLQMVVADT